MSSRGVKLTAHEAKLTTARIDEADALVARIATPTTLAMMKTHFECENGAKCILSLLAYSGLLRDSESAA